VSAAAWDKPQSGQEADSNLCKVRDFCFNPAMSDAPKPRCSGPPHNPGIRELVSGKHKASPLKREDAMLGFRGWNERGYLPHRDEPGLTQFVTFHLAGSFPETLRSEWEALLKIEDGRDRRGQLEAYLDHGRGECHLKQSNIATLVENAFRFHHGRWYSLLAWVIMPNHVHLLIKINNTSLSKIIKELKRFTTREANKILQRGGAFWDEDYFDTYMRNTGQELKTRLYIENNPVKAWFVRESRDWPWSSARFRDEHGVLHL
jgi:REP element-mobilizing transposase RayT